MYAIFNCKMYAIYNCKMYSMQFTIVKCVCSRVRHPRRRTTTAQKCYTKWAGEILKVGVDVTIVKCMQFSIVKCMQFTIAIAIAIAFAQLQL